MCEKSSFTIFNQNFLLNFGVVQVGSLFCSKILTKLLKMLDKKGGGVKWGRKFFKSSYQHKRDYLNFLVYSDTQILNICIKHNIF